MRTLWATMSMLAVAATSLIASAAGGAGAGAGAGAGLAGSASQTDGEKGTFLRHHYGDGDRRR